MPYLRGRRHLYGQSYVERSSPMKKQFVHFTKIWVDHFARPKLLLERLSPWCHNFLKVMLLRLFLEATSFGLCAFQHFDWSKSRVSQKFGYSLSQPLDLNCSNADIELNFCLFMYFFTSKDFYKFSIYGCHEILGQKYVYGLQYDLFSIYTLI